jgi:hypothetical protein
MLLISPWVKPHVDSRTLDFTSVLAMIQRLNGLSTLDTSAGMVNRDAQANDMLDLFDFQGQPQKPLILKDRNCPTPTQTSIPGSVAAG